MRRLYESKTLRKHGSLAFIATAWFLAATYGLAAQAGETNAGRYVDPTLGFSFEKPIFEPSTKPGLTTVAVTLSGASDESIAPNVNVIVQNVDTTVAAYRAQQKKELASLGWEIIEQREGDVGGVPSLRTHARGRTQSLTVEFLAVALIREGRNATVLTCTTAAAEFTQFEAECDRVASSFQLEP